MDKTDQDLKTSYHLRDDEVCEKNLAKGADNKAKKRKFYSSIPFIVERKLRHSKCWNEIECTCEIQINNRI